MSFLFKSKAQDVITDYGRELKDKIGSSNYPRKAKIANGNRGMFTIYFPDGKFVDKFFHSYEEANKWCVSNGISVSDECESAQDAADIIKWIQDDVRKTIQILRELNNVSGTLKDAANKQKNIISGSGISSEAKLVDKATRILEFAERVERESYTLLATSY
jgi:hypothetical protein